MTFFSANPMKMCLFGHFCMQNSFLHLKLSQNLWFLRNMQKMKKNIYHHYFLFCVIFSKSLMQKCLIPTESCFLDGKKPNIAILVDINFLTYNEKNRQAIGFAKMEG